MMERMPWTQRQNRELPLRFRDNVPHPPPPLLLARLRQTEPIRSNSNSSQPEPSLSSSVATSIGSGVHRIFRTPGNIFGLSRQYEGTSPSYDPEEHISLQDLSNIHVPAKVSESEGFYPYPNPTAFALGDWYWNGGAQKSQSSFHKLMDIIGDPQFRPADVQNVNWVQINKELGTDDDKEWLDEDAGWTRTPITISVPYQSHRGIHPDHDAGPRNYTVNDFYHRSLVSIIQEKISGLTDGHRFHFEPYKLIWQCNRAADPVQVQGELYTSPAFISAHQELQNLPGEPGCDLPRVVAALMFWSDSTQLTSFGNAKLWPLYLFFGNDSKYRRCKPSYHLCEHVAYFKTVSWVLMITF
jgi:Plavaka transposase